MIKLIENYDSQALNSFVCSHPFNHYMKTTDWAIYKSAQNGSKIYNLGFEDNGTLVASAAVQEIKAGSGTYLYVPTGLCVDYLNEELSKECHKLLVEFAKHKKAIYLRVDPNVQRVEKDLEGNVVAGGINNEFVTTYLKEMGFKHRGYGYGYDGSSINRFTLIVPLENDYEAFLKTLPKNKQNTFRRQARLGITTRKGTLDEVKYLVEYGNELSDLKSFVPHDEAFFTDLITSLPTIANYYVSEIDFDFAINQLETELGGSKYKTDVKARESAEKELENMKALRDTYGSKFIIGASILMKYGNKAWSLFTYTSKKLMHFRANDNIHKFIIADLYQEGVSLYDLVGFSGVVDENDPYYGLYSYKKSWNPMFYEQIGEFDLVLNPTKYFVLRYGKAIKTRIRYYSRKLAGK